MRKVAMTFLVLISLLSACGGGGGDESQSTPTAPTGIPAVASVSVQPGYSTENPITANGQWTRVVREFDGVEMVLVPAGCFVMGSTDEQIDAALAACKAGGGAVHEGVGGQCDRGWYADEQPATGICFDTPFWIDRYEVINRQFAKFGGQAARGSRFTGDNRPREQITWFEARDYCALRGARLPTEAEWEYAARGPDNSMYPWGNDFVADNVVCVENSDHQTGEVGAEHRPGGVSWVGAYDLSGNVWEWVSTLYRRYPYSVRSESDTDTTNWRVLRGNSWDVQSFFLYSSDRSMVEPDYSDEYGGVRCALSWDNP